MRLQTNQKGQFIPVHGMSNTSTYHSWEAMKQRCLNPKDKGYKRYGGRGIDICESWKASFQSFLVDMGVMPENCELDRIDNNKGYSPENCKWSTKSEQAKNRRTSSLWIINDKVYASATEAATELATSESTVHRWCKGYITNQGNYMPPKSGCSFEKRYQEGMA